MPKSVLPSPAKWTPGEETIEPSLDLVGLL